jgi:hypothetical protein
MEWNDKELCEIRLIIEHMSASLNIAYGITLLLDITQEKVLFCRKGKTFKSISISGDNARGVLCDIMENSVNL